MPGFIHGMRDTPTYSSWVAMRRRCSDKNFNTYYLYGALGIKVCKRWSQFLNFLEDMGERPSRCTLDRIDSSKHYCKSNCRWANAKMQSSNRRNVRWFTIDGTTKHMDDWIRHVGLPKSTVTWRVYEGWPFEEALGLVKRK